MVKRYDEHPLGELSDEQLDQILDNYISSYSAENHKNIVRKTKLKKKEPIVRVTFTKHKMLLVAVLLLFFIPVGTYVAAKLWEVTVDKQGYELTTKIDKPANQQPDTGYYRLVAEYVPEYFTVDEDPYTLSFYEDLGLDEEDEENWEALSNARVMSFQLYELNEKDTVIDEYIKDYKEIKLSKGKAYMLKQTDNFGKQENTIVRRFFENHNKFVDLQYHGNISQKDIEKILDNLHLVSVATAEEATSVGDYFSPDDLDERFTKLLGSNEPMALDINNKNEVVQLNEAINTIDIYNMPLQEITVTRATLSDKIAPEQLSVLNERLKVGTDYEWAYNAKWDKKGKLLPLTATEYTWGDGKSTLSKEVREFKIEPKYLEVELQVKNVTEAPMEYAPYIQVRRLIKQGDTFTDLPTDTFLVSKVYSNPEDPYISLNVPAYTLPTTVGEIVDRTIKEETAARSIAPGETATFTSGYIVVYEEYDYLFMNLNAYTPGKRYIQLTQ